MWCERRVWWEQHMLMYLGSLLRSLITLDPGHSCLALVEPVGSNMGALLQAFGQTMAETAEPEVPPGTEDEKPAEEIKPKKEPKV
jgi:hypothetical protein